MKLPFALILLTALGWLVPNLAHSRSLKRAEAHELNRRLDVFGKRPAL